MSAERDRLAAETLEWAKAHRPELVPEILRTVLTAQSSGAAAKQAIPVLLLEDLVARYWKAAGRFLGSADSKRFRLRYLCEAQPYPDKPPLGKWPVMDITTQTMEDYRALRTGQETRLIDPKTGKHRLTSPASRNAEVRDARKLYNWALQQIPRIECVPYNPLAKVRMEPENNIRKTTLGTDEEFERLIGACTNDVDLALIMIANDSGPRRMIVMSLRWDQINWDTGRITVLAADSSTKKRGKPFLMPETLDVLRRLREEQRKLDATKPKSPPTEYVFANTRIYPTGTKHPRYGEPMNPRYVYKRYKAVVERSGLKGVNDEPITFHTLRHRFAYVGRVKMKLKQKAMMAVMGHSTAKSHERYGFGDEEEVAEVHEKFLEEARRAHERAAAEKELPTLPNRRRADPAKAPLRDPTDHGSELSTTPVSIFRRS